MNNDQQQNGQGLNYQTQTQTQTQIERPSVKMVFLFFRIAACLFLPHTRPDSLSDTLTLYSPYHQSNKVLLRCHKAFLQKSFEVFYTIPYFSYLSYLSYLSYSFSIYSPGNGILIILIGIELF